MRIFLSYAREQRSLAERIAIGLRAERHDVFFDVQGLAPGDNFNQRIRAALRRADVLVFVLSPESVAPGSYALTELTLARERWPVPTGRIVVVKAAPVPHEHMPGYLAAVTMLEPSGDFVAETLAAIAAMAKRRRRRRWIGGAGAAAVLAAALLAAFLVRRSEVHVAREEPKRNAIAEQTVVLPEPVGTRGRAIVAPGSDTIVAALADPPALAFVEDGRDGAPPELAMPGEITTVAPAGDRVLVGVLYPPAVHLVDVGSHTIVDTVAIPSDDDSPHGGPVSAEPATVAMDADAHTWVRTGGGQGASGLFVRDGGVWSTPSYVDAFFPDADSVLRGVHGLIWAVETNTTPASLLRLTRDTLTEFRGHDYESISCAKDVAPGPEGDVLLLGCDGALLRVRVNGSRLHVVQRWPTSLRSTESAGAWDTQIIETAGDRVVAATSVYDVGTGRAIATTVAAYDTTGVETVLLRTDEARVDAMAATARRLVAVLRFPDGARRVHSVTGWPLRMRGRD